jgi:hypothetical protein
MNVSLDRHTVLFTRGDDVPGSIIGEAFHSDAQTTAGLVPVCNGCALRRRSNGGPMPDTRACDLIWTACGCYGSWKTAAP